MTVLEQLTRKQAKRITQNGAIVLATDGDAVLLAAFAELGWSDPHADPPVVQVDEDDVVDHPVVPPVVEEEIATVRDEEHTMLSHGRGHTVPGRRR